MMKKVISSQLIVRSKWFIVHCSLFIVFLLSTIYYLPSTTYAVETCTGKTQYEDETSTLNPLPRVTIEIFSGSKLAPNKDVTLSDDQGNYSLKILGFGQIVGLVNKVVFTSNGYQDQVFDTAKSQSCPGDVTLQAKDAKGYYCNNGTCAESEFGGDFSDKDSCEVDCGNYIYDSVRGICIENDNSGEIKGQPFISLKLCQNRTSITSINKYKYNKDTNQCDQDVIGVSLADCEKSLLGIDKQPIGKEEPGKIGLLPLEGFRNFLKNDFSLGRYKNLGGLAGLTLNIFYIGGGFLMLYWLIWGVFQYIIAQGNKESLAKANSRITWAVLGFLFLMMSYMLSGYVQTIFERRSTQTVQEVTVPPPVKK